MVPRKCLANMNHQNLQTSRKRALAYVRISSQRQINGESPETQRVAIQQFVDNDNADVVEWYYDEAKSGKNTEREGLQKLLKHAVDKRSEIDYVVVYKMNRASRDLMTYMTGFRMVLQQAGIAVKSATEQFDDTPTGHLLESFYVMIGQLDNETKRGFTVDNMTRLAEQGYWQFPAMIGYDLHKISNEIGKLRPSLKPNAMAPIVKDVLEKYSQGGMTKAELTRYAYSKGLRSRYGNKLSEDRIHRLLQHPIYAGYVTGKLNKGELYEGKHEALISKQTYDLNQSLLFGKRVRAGEKRLLFNPDYPLKGLVRCPNCMKPLYASAPKTGAGGRAPRYHCSRSSCRGLYKSIKADTMHDDFYELLQRIKPDSRLLKLYKEVLITESINQLGSLNAKIGKLRGELNRIDENRLSAIRKFNNDQLKLDEKEELLAALKQEKIDVSKDLRDLKAQQTVREADIEFTVNSMQDLDLQWLQMSPRSKQRFQSILFPQGLVYDYELGRFGTSQISQFYRLVATKKDSEEPSKSFLVAGAGFEPATLWL